MQSWALQYKLYCICDSHFVSSNFKGLSEKKKKKKKSFNFKDKIKFYAVEKKEEKKFSWEEARL